MRKSLKKQILRGAQDDKDYVSNFGDRTLDDCWACMRLCLREKAGIEFVREEDLEDCSGAQAQRLRAAADPDGAIVFGDDL